MGIRCTQGISVCILVSVYVHRRVFVYVFVTPQLTSSSTRGRSKELHNRTSTITQYYNLKHIPIVIIRFILYYACVLLL